MSVKIAGGGFFAASVILLAAGYGGWQFWIVDEPVGSVSRPTEASRPAATPLMIASARCSMPDLKKLLASGSEIDQPGAGQLTPLMVAAQQGCGHAVEALLIAGATADLVDLGGHNALMFGSRSGDLASVKSLLAANADPNHVDEHNVSVLMEAVRGGDDSVLSVLLEAGADPAWAADGGETLLHFAADSSPAVLRRLLALGLDVDVRNDLGVTPLIRAAKMGRLDLVEILVEVGADANLRDADGKLALDVAIQNKNWGVVEYLTATSASSIVSAESMP